MVNESVLAYGIPLLPLIAFVLNIFWGKRLGKNSAWVSIVASSISCAMAMILAHRVIHSGPMEASFVWLVLDQTPLKFGYLLNPLSITLLFVVTVVGTLIQIYSVGYMHGDKRFSRFFAYLSLFMFAMLTLTIANNFILFFMAWEIVGLCSYFLIGFWFEKPSAANAGKKAFLTTRLGDVGFLLGLLTLFVATGTFQFSELEPAVQSAAQSPLIALAAGLIFCGTIGKSAQFPLHVWLPDAMEGPTPVSALIHAATMVAAGVYLLARSFVIFEAVPGVAFGVAVIGSITALMAAFFALTATDIKKVLAYSTISQLGYMVTAMGLGGAAPGMFHLVTHAFFKALLFLGAGSVIHGTGTQDIREMGGLFGKMKSTSFTFLIASLAIAGIPPFAGFWSKDEILVAAHRSGHTAIYFVLALTALMTAFYMFRLFILTFLGKPRNPKIHAHESPRVMTLPLWVLAAGSVSLGLPGSPWMGNWFQKFLLGTHAHAIHEPDIGLMILSVFLAAAGISLAALLYRKGLAAAGKIANRLNPLYQMSANKLWFDEIYTAWIVEPFKRSGRLLFAFDQAVIDRIVNLTGLGTLALSKIKNWLDIYLVDGCVNLTGVITHLLSAGLRKVQTGLIQNYLFVVFGGVLVLLLLGMK